MPLEPFLLKIRNGDVPPFQVFQATGAPSGEVSTPPPYVMLNFGPSTPTPKGQGHICVVDINEREMKPTQNEITVKNAEKDD